MKNKKISFWWNNSKVKYQIRIKRQNRHHQHTHTWSRTYLPWYRHIKWKVARLIRVITIFHFRISVCILSILHVRSFAHENEWLNYCVIVRLFFSITSEQVNIYVNKQVNNWSLIEFVLRQNTKWCQTCYFCWLNWR